MGIIDWSSDWFASDRTTRVADGPPAPISVHQSWSLARRLVLKTCWPPGRPLDSSKGRRTPPDLFPAQSRSCAGNAGAGFPSALPYLAAAIAHRSLVPTTFRVRPLSSRFRDIAFPIVRKGLVSG